MRHIQSLVVFCWLAANISAQQRDMGTGQLRLAPEPRRTYPADCNHALSRVHAGHCHRAPAWAACSWAREIAPSCIRKHRAVLPGPMRSSVSGPEPSIVPHCIGPAGPRTSARVPRRVLLLQGAGTLASRAFRCACSHRAQHPKRSAATLGISPVFVDWTFATNQSTILLSS